MRVLEKPTARMLAVVRRSRDAILAAFLDATEEFVAGAVTVVILRGLTRRDISLFGDLVFDLGDGWGICHIPRSHLGEIFPRSGWPSWKLRQRAPIVVMGDDMGQKKIALLTLEDLGLCVCGLVRGREDERASDWIVKAVASRLKTISKQLGADGPLDPAETVIDATVIACVDPEEPEFVEDIERQNSGTFHAPKEYVVKVSTRSRSDEWLRLASHHHECLAIAALNARKGKEFVVRCRYDGTETFCHAELPGALE